MIWGNNRRIRDFRAGYKRGYNAGFEDGWNLSMRAGGDGGACPGPYRDDNDYVTGAQISRETAGHMMEEMDAEYEGIGE